MQVASEVSPVSPRHPLAIGDSRRLLAIVAGQGIELGTFFAHVRGVAAQLPAGLHAINLCEDRYRFMVAFCAVALRGQVNLLPPSRAPAVVLDVQQRYRQTYCLGDALLDALPEGGFLLPPELPCLAGEVPQLADEQLVAIGFTSGSTGVPSANPKTWGSFLTSTAQNLRALRDLWADEPPSLVATVPPQHMYGMEMSLLLSGTASVVGHATLHGDSTHRQLQETFANFEALINAARVHSPALPPHFGAGSRLKVYVDDAAEIAAVRQALATHLPADVPYIVLHATVCRHDLRVEIDGVHGA